MTTSDDLALGMMLVDEAIPAEHCQQLIDWMNEGADWSRSGVVTPTGVEAKDVRTSSTVSFPYYDYAMPRFVQDINWTVHGWVREYCRETGAMFTSPEPPSIQRYEPGEKYDLHYDSGPGTPRSVSAVLYLNEGPEGGETDFPLLGCSMTPKTGALIVFPSNFIYKHAALPPVGWTKYAAAYWYRDQ